MPANSRNRSKSNLLNRLMKNYYERLLYQWKCSFIGCYF